MQSLSIIETVKEAIGYHSSVVGEAPSCVFLGPAEFSELVEEMGELGFQRGWEVAVISGLPVYRTTVEGIAFPRSPLVRELNRANMRMEEHETE